MGAPQKRAPPMMMMIIITRKCSHGAQVASYFGNT